MIAALLKAHERDDFVAAVRALDRVLMSGFYVVPLYHLPAQWVARWTTIAHPAETSLFGYLPETWWRRTGPMILGDPKTEDACRRPRSTMCSAAPPRGGPTPSRWPIRPTATASPTARRAVSPTREADRVVSAIASRLRTLGLQTDAIVGIQLANTRRERADAARRAARRPDRCCRCRCYGGAPTWHARSARLGAKAIVTTSRIGDFDACAMAMQVAADDLFDPPCLQLRPQSAGRRDRARRPAA